MSKGLSAFFFVRAAIISTIFGLIFIAYNDRNICQEVKCSEIEEEVCKTFDTQVVNEIKLYVPSDSELITEQTTESDEEIKETSVEGSAETIINNELCGFYVDNHNYSVNGAVLDKEISTYYWNLLNDFNIPYWYEIGMWQMYQESNFNVYAENKNGLDKGLLQYRILYWEEACAECGIYNADIFDPYIQLYVYVYNTAKRINQGKSVNEIISDHNTGGYGYSQTYVDEVRQWEYVR